MTRVTVPRAADMSKAWSDREIGILIRHKAQGKTYADIQKYLPDRGIFGIKSQYQKLSKGRKKSKKRDAKKRKKNNVKKDKEKIKSHLPTKDPSPIRDSTPSVRDSTSPDRGSSSHSRVLGTRLDTPDEMDVDESIRQGGLCQGGLWARARRLRDPATDIETSSKITLQDIPEDTVTTQPEVKPEAKPEATTPVPNPIAIHDGTSSSDNQDTSMQLMLNRISVERYQASLREKYFNLRRENRQLRKGQASSAESAEQTVRLEAKVVEEHRVNRRLRTNLRNQLGLGSVAFGA